MVGDVYIGVAGWSYPDWNGIVYPQGKIDQLRYLIRFVDVIEINSTFYQTPSQRNSKSWLERTKEKKEFFFTAKLHREFTHERKMELGTIKQFHKGFEPLTRAGKLKHLLVQFRYDFSDSQQNRKHLTDIVKNFSDMFSLAVEVRHKSWQKPQALDFMEELGVTVCNLDYPVGKTSFDMQHCTIGKEGYFRLHGRNEEKWFTKSTRDETYNYYYRKSELEEVKSRIDELRKAYKTLIVIGNNHYRGAELANALELKAMLSGKKQLVPEGLLRAYPQVSDIALNKNLF